MRAHLRDRLLALDWRPPTGGTLLHAAPVQLRAIPEVTPQREGDAVWNQIAAEGCYKGHPTGEFKLDEKAFGEIVANFRRHPSYEPNAALRVAPNGEVVAWDFHHASEEPPTTVAVGGSPAQAWALELDTRKGEDGLLQLWALVRWKEPAGSYVQEGKYKWASIAVWPDAVDPKSGEKVGWYMSSIALTNDPFIQGMAPLAATRKSTDLSHQLKKLLDLPETADDSTMLEAVAKLGRAATDPAPPATNVARTHPPEKKHMPKLLARIGTLVGVEVPAGADDAEQAVLAERIVTAIKLAQGDRAKAESALAALAQVLGVDDATGAAARVAELMKASALLNEVMPALAALQDGEAPAEEDAVAEDEEADVMAAMRSHGMPEAAKPALRLMRSGNVKMPRLDLTRPPSEIAGQVKALVAARAAKRAAKAAFLAQYPVPGPGEAHLLTNYATQPRTNPVPVQHDSPGAGAANRIDLSRFSGRNTIERAMSYVDPDGKLTLEKRHEQAVFLVRDLRTQGALTT
ncbi:MAG TPA: phage protease [Thermoleophilia bacterium]|nr:phage protease [Thermoleophilia bacterium]